MTHKETAISGVSFARGSSPMRCHYWLIKCACVYVRKRLRGWLNKLHMRPEHQQQEKLKIDMN